MEGYANFTLDNYGYNNDNIPKKNKSYRIAILGNSITEAQQVGREYNFTTLVQKELNNSYGLQCEVLNLGMNGRGVPDYIGFANDYKEILSPDHFIIQVRASDFHYGSHNTNIFGVEIKEGKYHLRKNNDKDNLFQKIKNVKDEMGWFKPLVGYSAISFQRNRLDYHIKNFIKKFQFSKDDKSIEDSNQLVSDRLKLIDWEMQKLNENYKGNFSVLYISNSPIIKDGSVEIIFDDSLIKNQIKRFCKKNKIEFIDPIFEMNNAYLEKNIMPFGFNNVKIGKGHLNKHGHKIIAAKLINVFSKKLDK